MNPEQPIDQTQSPCEACKSTRRDLLLKVGVGLNVVAGAMIGIPLAGYALSSFMQKMPLKWLPLGPVSQFPAGTTRLATYLNPYRRTWDGSTADLPCWVRHIADNDFQVFAINCTHLGCPVRWFEESKLFMCPCHGGVFYQDGTHAAGPPPRPLYQYRCEVRGDELWIEGGLLPTLADPEDPELSV
jgi:menaquinol-cytochrome c reductase iron-sulfur subunit